MSGGHFDYQQYRIDEIADSIEYEIRHNENGMKCYEVCRNYGAPYDSEWVYTSWKDDKRYKVPQKNIIKGEVYYYGDDDGIPIFDRPQGWYRNPPEILEIFKEGVKKLREAAVYAQRIDWYLSGDDGEESLIKRLKKDLEEVRQKIKDLENNNWYIGVREQEEENT